MIFVGLVASEPARAAVLAKDGENRATIVTPPDMIGAVGYAVDDLAHYISAVSGGDAPPVVDSPDKVDTPVTIWVGVSDALKQRHGDLDLSFDRTEQFVVAVRGDDVILAGHDAQRENGQTLEAGTAQAIYSFLREPVGVRWLWPGELGTDVPTKPTLELDDMTRRYAPTLLERRMRYNNYESIYLQAYPQPEERELDIKSIAARLQRETNDWYRRQHGTFVYGDFGPGTHNYVRRVSAGHAYIRWYDRYGKSHPDYFALQPDGTRNPYPTAKHVKLCISNPAVIEQHIENIASRWGEDAPARAVSSVSPNDGGYQGYCTCDDCRAWDVEPGPNVPTTELHWAEESREHVALTDRYVHYWNRVARGLKARYPDSDVSVATWAYGAYVTPPMEQKFEENVLVGVVASMGAATEKGRSNGRRLWQQWADAGPELYWRPNLFHHWWAMPVLFSQRIAEDISYMADRRLVGMDVDSPMNHWATQGLQYYLLMRLAWNPGADVDALITDYTDRAFGAEAGPYMRRYFERLEEAYHTGVELKAGLRRYEAAKLYPRIFTPDLLAALRRDIERAESAMTGPRRELYRKRLAFVEKGLRFTELQIDAIDAMSELRRGGAADVRQSVQRAYDTTRRRDDFLHEQADNHTINPIYAFGDRQRRNMGDYLGPPVDSYRALLGEGDSAVQRSALPTEWDFRMDREKRGRDEKWYTESVADELTWRRLLVTRPWDDQILSDDPVAPEPIEYHGTGWYRTTFDAEPVSEGETVWLHFGAIDEGAWVYLNGELVGAQPYDRDKEPEAWLRPRRFDITEHVRGGENHLVVEVRSAVGQSGITRPVFIRRMPRNIVKHSGFSQGLKGWRIGPSKGPQDGYSYDVTLGRYVTEPALRVTVHDGGKASMRQKLDEPLKAGKQYQVSVRHKQQLREGYSADVPPLRMRLYGLADDGDRRREDRFWLRGDDDRETEWTSLVKVIEAPRDYEQFQVTLFFWAPGKYVVDEVVVRPID